MTDIEITDVVDHEDGSSTMTFDMSDDATKTMASCGLKFVLYCAAYEVSIEEAFSRIGRKDGKSMVDYETRMSAMMRTEKYMTKLETQLAKALNIAALALDALHEIQTYKQPDDPDEENALTRHELYAFDFNVEIARRDLREMRADI